MRKFWDLVDPGDPSWDEKQGQETRDDLWRKGSEVERGKKKRLKNEKLWRCSTLRQGGRQPNQHPDKFTTDPSP